MNKPINSYRLTYVVCPFLPSRHEEDWGLEDPTGKSDEEFVKTAKIIEEKVKDLAERIRNNEIDMTVERDIR